MRIGVISDTHGGLESWNAVSNGPFAETDLVIHAGDIFYHGIKNPQPEGYDTIALAQAINNFPRPLIFCKGNCDSEVDQLVVDIPIQAPYAVCHLEGLNLLVHHGHILGDEEVLRLASRWDFGICISGHTHIPRLERKENVLFLNPGSPALPKGEGIPTVGLIETPAGEEATTRISVLHFREDRVLESTTVA